MAGKLTYGIEAVANWNIVRIWTKVKQQLTPGPVGLAKVRPMLFLLRSIFWLSIVFASIPWPGGSHDLVMAKARTARGAKDMLGQMTGIAQAGVGEACLRAPAACLEGAMQLNRMIAGQRAGGNGKAPPKSPAVDASAAAN